MSDLKILVEWYNPEKTIIHQTFKQHWSLEDYWSSVRVTHDLLHSVTHKVCLISTIEGLFAIPKGFIASLRTASNNVRANEGIHVVVGGGFLVNTLIEIGAKIDRRNQARIVSAKSVTEAERLVVADLQIPLRPIASATPHLHGKNTP
jgi:hypothetical protein